MTAPNLVEHFFRHEYGRLVATLSRRAGVQYIEAVEDAVQSALMTALEAWTTGGQPDNPSAWLFRVAHNELVGELRQRTRRSRIMAGSEEILPPENGPEVVLAGEMRDDLLRMLFVCCDRAIPVEELEAMRERCRAGCAGRPRASETHSVHLIRCELFRKTLAQRAARGIAQVTGVCVTILVSDAVFVDEP